MEKVMAPGVTKRRRGQGVSVTDVARTAGVSIATVSRAINQPEVVSEETRKRVNAAMKSLNYHLNPAASALRRGHGNVITVLVASLGQPWYTKLMRALKSEIEARGFSMMQIDLQHSSEALQHALLPNNQHLPTGIILATGDTLDTPEVREAIQLAHDSLPLTVIGQHVMGASWPTVQFTDELWSYRATLELLAFGGPVAFLGLLEGSYLAAERLRGYERAHQEAGLDAAEWIWPIGNRGYDAGQAEVQSRIAMNEIPRSIFAINDELALGASRALIAAGLRIPEDVSLMGYGNTEFLEYVTPSLSSVDGSATDAASVAVSALWAQLEGKDFSELTVLDRQIVHRESTAISSPE